MNVTPRTLVLGIGNLLLSDEGVGVRVVERLQGRSWPDRVDLLDGGTGGFHLLGQLGAYRHVVIVDAALDQRPVGTVWSQQVNHHQDFPRVLSAHDIGLRDLVDAARLLGTLPDLHLVAISIDPRQDMGMQLSPPVEAAIEPACECVAKCVEHLTAQ